MTTKINNQFSPARLGGKFGDLLFARQAPVLSAPTHPGILSGVAARFTAWHKRRAAIAELSALSDRELADIGITRDQIPTAVK
jgi:uncharacterized protein YjiS (DUF1127 family)